MPATAVGPANNATPTKVPGLIASLAPSVTAGGLAFLLLVLFPVHTSRFLGVIATMALCLLMLTAFYAALRIAAQLFDSPHLFRLFGLRRAPVVEIVVVGVVLAAIFGKGGDLHAIRPPVVVAVDKRPTLSEAFNTWAANTQQQYQGNTYRVDASGQYHVLAANGWWYPVAAQR